MPLGCSSLSSDLLAGAVWRYSVDGGETFTDTPPVLTADGEVVELISWTTFDVFSAAGMAELHLHINVPYYSQMTMAVNGVPIDRPYEELGYHVIRGIDPAALKVGRNELAVVDTVKKYGKGADQLPPTTARLVPMAASDLAFRTGPVLGAFDAAQFSVTCRTNMRATVICRARPVGGGEEVVVASLPGLIHKFAVRRAEGIDANEYRLEASIAGVTRMTDWLPAPQWADVTDGSMRFAVASDVQTVSAVWPALTAAIVKQRPNLLVFTGDMVANGRHDASWDREFLGPARELFAVTPLYPVEGNHELESPILPDLFYTAAPEGRGLTWAQQVGEVLLIAINGVKSYATGTDNYAWLERTLAASDAKFIFLFSHYPAFGSDRYAGVDASGKPIDGKTHQGRIILMPLLARYNATAMVGGHDHFYERSEPPGGVTAIICGGGGGRLSSRNGGWENVNPCSRAYASRHHYLLFDVDADTCTMKAFALNGELLDTRTWQARQP
jgi:hypothetical protein